MSATLHCGDALTVLKTLPAASCRCCVTSPPYWGLRDYGTARWEGGDAACSHMAGIRAGAKSTLHGGRGQMDYERTETQPFVGDCGKCGARRVDAQVGLERTPEEYVEKMVAVFREVRRVLTQDGTLWCNMGDSYAGHNFLGEWRDGNEVENGGASNKNGVGYVDGIKPKDLVGIPWRLAFALQADGWWLRSDIIWSKANPMPESVTDRPTKAHEYVFLLSKAARYYYDATAIAEDASAATIERIAQPRFWGQHGGPKDPKDGNRSMRKALENLATRNRDDRHVPHPSRGRSRRAEGTQTGGNLSSAYAGVEWLSRNARSVWEIATQPYPEAHFATFPEELARRCILAGSAPGDVVLDPFGGSGTVAQVATGNGRGSVYIDLNPKYVELARQRIGPMLCEMV